MRKRFLLFLACCIGLSVGLSCTTRQAPSPAPQSPASHADADAKAKKEQDAADAKALKKSQDDAARQAKASQSSKSAATTANASFTQAQKLNNLTRRYLIGEISPLEYHTERAKIVAEPETPEAPAPEK